MKGADPVDERATLDLIRLVQRARMAHDDQARPSQVSGAYWLEAKAAPATRPGPTARATALRAECELSAVDAIWDILRKATQAGRLGYKAKVAAAAREADADCRELRILVADRADAVELARLRAELRALTPGLRWTLLSDEGRGSALQ